MWSICHQHEGVNILCQCEMKSNHSFSFLKWHQNDFFRLFTIYIDKQRYNEQSSDFKSLSRLVNFVPESSFPFALISSIYPEKRPRKAETGIKDGLEEIEHIFPFGKFRLGKQAYLSRRTVASWNFPPKRPEKSCSIYFPTGFPRNFL